MRGSLGILILGGGQATRLPGKLTLAYDDRLPMIARVYRNVTARTIGSVDDPRLRSGADDESHASVTDDASRMSRNDDHGKLLGNDDTRVRFADREVFISCKETFARDVDALLPVPMVVDRWSMRGPLGGMLTTMAAMRSRFVFAVAGDAPFIDAAFIATICAAHRDGDGTDGDADEAVVPVHDRGGKQQYEPLAALYDRLAFLREGLPVLRSGRGALRSVLDRLRTRTLAVDDSRVFTNVNTPADDAALRAQLAQEPA